MDFVSVVAGLLAEGYWAGPGLQSSGSPLKFHFWQSKIEMKRPWARRRMFALTSALLGLLADAVRVLPSGDALALTDDACALGRQVMQCTARFFSRPYLCSRVAQDDRVQGLSQPSSYATAHVCTKSWWPQRNLEVHVHTPLMICTC